MTNIDSVADTGAAPGADLALPSPSRRPLLAASLSRRATSWDAATRRAPDEDAPMFVKG